MITGYIDADAFISVLKERQKEFDGCGRAFGKTAFCVLEETINKLQLFPKADVAPVVHAHWICLGFGDYECSHCHEYITEDFIEGAFFCDNCGAKMDEEVSEDAG